MKNTALLLPAIFSVFTFSMKAATGDGTEKSLPSYVINKTVADKSLKKNEALFVFTLYDFNGSLITEPVRFSCDGKNETVRPNVNGSFRSIQKPGKHKFQLFYTDRHFEIYTDSIKIPAASRMEITVYFQRSDIRIEADKPVIYLYPEKETEVSVQLKPKGNFTFTYPAYNNGWKCTASADGTLSFGDKKYGYLFWEGGIELSKNDISTKEGFVVSKDKLVGFLEEKLYAMGLNAKEVQDFITYWYPRMSVNQDNYIHFMFNETYNEYAKIDIKPKPDNIFRVFMIWSKAAAGQVVQPQQIPSCKRNGFTVVEWGGTEISENVFNLK
jgi:hypothetical protein